MLYCYPSLSENHSSTPTPTASPTGPYPWTRSESDCVSFPYSQEQYWQKKTYRYAVQRLYMGAMFRGVGRAPTRTGRIQASCKVISAALVRCVAEVKADGVTPQRLEWDGRARRLAEQRLARARAVVDPLLAESGPYHWSPDPAWCAAQYPASIPGTLGALWSWTDWPRHDDDPRLLWLEQNPLRRPGDQR